MMTFLGALEFILCYDFYTNAAARTAENPLLPAVVGSNKGVTVIYCTFVLMLALQRLTYGLSKPTFMSWLCTVVTHAIESSLWWFLALNPFIEKGEPVKDFVKSVVTLQAGGGALQYVLLLGVPTLVLALFVRGPPKAQAAKKNN